MKLHCFFVILTALPMMVAGADAICSHGLERVSLSQTTEMLVEPSNNNRGMKRVAFPIVGKKNYIFDGGGKEFVFENGVFPFAVKDCQNVILKNFSMRNEYAGLVQFKIVAKDNEGFTICLEPDVQYRVLDGDIDFVGPDGRWKSVRMFSFHSIDRMLIRYVFSASGKGSKDALAANFMATTVQEAGPGLVRFNYRPDSHPKNEKCAFRVGESVTFALGAGRQCIAMFFENCQNVTVENVTLSRFVGMGLDAQLCSNVTVRGYSTRPFGTDRVTTTADDMMFTCCEGDILVEDCEIQDSQDDGCNVHGNYHVVSSVDGARVKVRAMHFEQRGFFPYRMGDSIDIISTNDCAVLASARVLRFVSRDEPGVFAILELDREILPSLVGMLVENTSLKPNVTLRNNTFVNVPHIRLSGRGKIVVENNVFRRLTGGILATDLIDYWYEYGRITDMTVRGNVFDGIRHPFRSGVNRWRYGDSSVPKIHGRLTFVDNVFTNCSPSGVSINGFKEVIRGRPLPRPVCADGSWEMAQATAPDKWMPAVVPGRGDAAWRPAQRWRGFNLLGMFLSRRHAEAPATDPTWSRTPGYFQETDFRWMHEWGFNFARLPLDYRCWIKGNDWNEIDELELEKLDDAIRLGRKYGIHVQLCLHRAPGFCINPPKEPKNLFHDAEAFDVCARHWRCLARRYRDIPNCDLSFDLFNEPDWWESKARTNIVRVVQGLAQAIRDEDPDRLIVADGYFCGRDPITELADRTDIVQSIHAYEPSAVSHFRAEWRTERDLTSVQWPPEGVSDGVQWLRSKFYDPWFKLRGKGVFLYVGETGVYKNCPHDVTLRFMEDKLKLWQSENLGWCLWNLRGTFGIVDSGRADVDYEDLEGHKLDRKFLDLLRKY